MSGVLDWDAIEAEIAEQNRKDFDRYAESNKAKSKAERKRAIANGWMDEDGNSLLPEEPEEEEEDDE